MDQNRKRGESQDMPNRASNMEPAEGSRENVRNSGNDDRSRGSSNTGGITNRPLDRERSEQRELPDRGRSQSDSNRSQSDRDRSSDLDRSQSER
jgi:hypothetical protein